MGFKDGDSIQVDFEPFMQNIGYLASVCYQTTSMTSFLGCH